MATNQIVVRLPKDLASKLARAEKRMGIRKSELVRAALRAYLGTSLLGRRPAERVAHLIGSLESGIPDLAEQHRRYILESLQRGR